MYLPLAGLGDQIGNIAGVQVIEAEYQDIDIRESHEQLLPVARKQVWGGLLLSICAIMRIAGCPPHPAQPPKGGCFFFCHLTHKVATLTNLWFQSG
jgi:hypothetical protein